MRLLRATAPACLAVALPIAMTWPLVLHLWSRLPWSSGQPDQLYWLWNQAWVGHALLHEPLDLFQTNRFWPEKDSLAFAEIQLGYAPLLSFTALGESATIAVYNIVFLLAYALAFLGAYLLATELGAGRLSAAVGGAAFAFAPFRLEQLTHLPVISSGGIPLALFLLTRGYRRRRSGLVFAGWLVATWQITLGFNLGLQLVYALLAVGVVATVYRARGDRSLPGRDVVAASAAGVCVMLVVTLLLARPFFRVIDAHPEARRTAEEVIFLSPPIQGFLAASDQSVVWGDPTADVRETLAWPYEQTLFPGLAVLVLALLGLVSSAYPRAVRAWLAIGVVACAAFSLGLRGEDHVSRGITPYRLLYEFAPGWEALRTPGRITTLTSLGLALLAAAGAALTLEAVRTRRLPRTPFRTRRRRDVAAVVTACGLLGLVLLEGLGRGEYNDPPAEPAGQRGAPDPQLHLPSSPQVDDLYGWWSIGDFPRVVNGHGSFLPSTLVRVRQVSADFPDPRSIRYLRSLGVRTVVLHPELTAGTPWQTTARRSTAGLPVVREAKGGVVLYHLRRTDRVDAAR